MREFWEKTHIRAQQSIGVWKLHQPELALGELTHYKHTDDVAQILSYLEDRDTQKRKLEQAVQYRNDNSSFIHEVNTRMPQLMAAIFTDDPAVQAEVKELVGIRPDSQQGNLERARRLIAAWTRINEVHAGKHPALTPLTLGATTLDEFKESVADHSAYMQAVEQEKAHLQQRKSQLRDVERRVDRNNKRWYAAWASTFPEGTPEHDALDLISTEQSTKPPSPLEIAKLAISTRSIFVTYQAGGGKHASDLQLLYKVQDVDENYQNGEMVILDGQTIGPLPDGSVVHVKTRASNSVRTVESVVKTVMLPVGGLARFRQ